MVQIRGGTDTGWYRYRVVQIQVHYRRTYFGGPSVSLCKDINRSTIRFINRKLSSMKGPKSLIKYFSSND